MLQKLWPLKFVIMGLTLTNVAVNLKRSALHKHECIHLHYMEKIHSNEEKCAQQAFN